MFFSKKFVETFHDVKKIAYICISFYPIQADLFLHPHSITNIRTVIS